MTTNSSTSTKSVPSFAVIPGAQVQDALAGREKQIVELAEATYRLHSAGDSVNPPSYFLRFSDRPTARIIALPASIGGQVKVDGIKWISSFPENVAAGIPRASAVLILNDHDTGYPFACMEASIISATRTAAMAAMAANGATVVYLSEAERKRWADKLPNVPMQWAESMEKKGLPGKVMLKGYLDGLRARGVKLARDWDK